MDTCTVDMGCLGVRWGTWEELLLGGAVLRHGTEAWDAVAGELRARSAASSTLFTPEECRHKFEDIQEQYSGCEAWFEELRKRRVTELKRELEKSEDSIGSLQSKLETLTSKQESSSNIEYNSSQAESTSPVGETDGMDSSSKEASRDGSSAGSSTGRPGRGQTGKCQNVVPASLQKKNLKMQQLEDSLTEKFGCGCSGFGLGILKKKRGKRKRKGCNVLKESSMEGSDMLSSDAFINKEGSAEDSNLDNKVPSEDRDRTQMCKDDGHHNLTVIMDSILRRKEVSIFGTRLESQKKGHYKKMIRRHIDFCDVSSRINNGSISSAEELFRDLLLLCNNALVFYAKNSFEYKSALVLRDLVNSAMRQSLGSHTLQCDCSDEEGMVLGSDDRPKKPRKELENSPPKIAPISSKRDGTSIKESASVAGRMVGTSVEAVVADKADGASVKVNAVFAGKTAGISVKENAMVAGRGTGAAKNPLVARKGPGAARNVLAAVTMFKENGMVAGKGIGLLAKGKAAVSSRGVGTPVKEKAPDAGKGVGAPLNESVVLAGKKRERTQVRPRGNNKGSRPDLAVEPPGRKRGIGRPLKGGQRGGRRRQDPSSNRGRKRACR